MLFSKFFHDFRIIGRHLMSLPLRSCAGSLECRWRISGALLGPSPFSRSAANLCRCGVMLTLSVAANTWRHKDDLCRFKSNELS